MNKTPLATYILIGLNVVVFAWLALQQQSLMMDTSADVLAIIRAGANLNPLTLGGQPWRIVTCMFLHFGVIHLLVNMYALYVLGKGLEPAMGSGRFVLVYLICGIAASIASLLFNVYIPSAGASGAIFGLFGYRLSAEIVGSFHDRQSLLNIFINFVVFVLINGAIAAFASVDIAGHVGGCIAGLIIGVFHFRLRWFIPEKYLALLAVLVASTLILLPLGQVRYYKVFQAVLNMEERLDQLFDTRAGDTLMKDSLANYIPRWDSILAALDKTGDLPEEVKRDTMVLRDYIQLRRQETFYRVRMVERESYIYYDSIEILSAKFQELPKLTYILNYKTRRVSDEPEEIIDETDGPVSNLRPVQVFYDANWRETADSAAAVYYRIGQQDSLGRWNGRVIDYYINGDIQMKGTYNKDMKDGIFIYYSPRKTYESAGRYSQEFATGKWENFHWNGALESEVYYGGGSFTANVFDSLGNQQVANGNGMAKRWYDNGQLAEEGTYSNGKKDGLWYGYYRDGEPYYKEEFRAGRLIHGVSMGRDGRRYVYDHLSEFPFPTDGMPAFEKYVELNKRRPFRLTQQGKVKLVFNVGEDGSTWDHVVIQSLSPECDQEAIRLVREGPAWRSALQHGQERVPSQGYVEIEF